MIKYCNVFYVKFKNFIFIKKMLNKFISELNNIEKIIKSDFCVKLIYVVNPY